MKHDLGKRAASSAAFLCIAGSLVSVALASCSDDALPLPSVPPPVPDAGADAAEDAPPDAPIDQPQPVVISEDPDSEAEAETVLAIAPDGTIGVAWMARFIPIVRSRVAYRFSRDGGISWTPVRYVSDEGFDFSADPFLTASQNSDFYVGWLGVEKPADVVLSSQIFVERVPAGADEMESMIEVTDASAGIFRDRPGMIETNNGALVVTYMEDDLTTVPRGDGVAAYSADQGQTWGYAVIHPVGDDEFVNLIGLCKPDDGGQLLYATYYHRSGMTFDIRLRSSDDDGVTWSEAVGLNKSPIRAGAMSPTCVARGTDVWVSHGVSKLPVSTNLQLQHALFVPHSSDQGASFAEILDFTDLAVGDLYLLGTLALEPNGAIDLFFYAGDNGTDETGAFLRRRWNGGAFDATEVVRTPVNFHTERTWPDWLGDYVGAVAGGDSLHVVFTDNASGKSHVVHQRIVLR